MPRLMPPPPKVGKATNKGKKNTPAPGAAPAPDKTPVVTPDPPAPEAVVDNVPVVTPDPEADSTPPVVIDPEGTHRFNLEPGKQAIDPDPEEMDEEILELLAAYVAAYPHNKIFHVASDGQVFLQTNKLDAHAHEKNMGGQLRSYTVK